MRFFQPLHKGILNVSERIGTYAVYENCCYVFVKHIISDAVFDKPSLVRDITKSTQHNIVKCLTFI